MARGPVELTRELIALAGHPETPKEEARTAAVTACKLIVKHKLNVGLEQPTIGDTLGDSIGSYVKDTVNGFKLDDLIKGVTSKEGK